MQNLRVFLSVLDRGSLSAAGRDLGMTQPAVSNHVHALEERFGVALIVRGGRLRPTPAGECLAEHAREVLAGISALEADMALHSAPRGRLAVGSSTTPGESVVPHLAARFSARYPEVDLDVRIADTDETLAALVGRRVEVAVVGEEVEDPRLEGRFVQRDELVPVIAASDPLAESMAEPQDLAGRPFVMREEGSATRRAAEEGLEAVGVVPRVAMELGSNRAVIEAVAEGAGVGIVPTRTLGAERSPEERVKRLEVRGLELSRPFVLVTERGRPLSPAAEAFAKMLVEGDSS